ncbi:hypothetical protein ACFFRR_002517 [Megaselia abdita]
MISLTKKVHRALSPTNLHEALYITSVYLKLSGLFPYRWAKDKYEVSPGSMVLSIIHVVVYACVNARLMYLDIDEYAAPVIYNNSVGVAGQFILKIVGVVLTLVLFLRVILGHCTILKILTFNTSLLQQLEEMDLDLKPLYRRLLNFSLVQTVLIVVMTIWTLADGIIFYQKMNNAFPTLEYFFVDIMSSLYKYCGLMNMFSYIYIIHIITEFMNGKFEVKCEEIFEKWKKREGEKF